MATSAMPRPTPVDAKSIRIGTGPTVMPPRPLSPLARTWLGLGLGLGLGSGLGLGLGPGLGLGSGQEDVHRLEIAVDQRREGAARCGAELRRDPRRGGLEPRAQRGDLWAAEEPRPCGGREGCGELVPALSEVSKLLGVARRECEGATMSLQPRCRAFQGGSVLPRCGVEPCRSLENLACLRRRERRHLVELRRIRQRLEEHESTAGVEHVRRRLLLVLPDTVEVVAAQEEHGGYVHPTLAQAVGKLIIEAKLVADVKQHAAPVVPRLVCDEACGHLLQEHRASRVTYVSQERGQRPSLPELAAGNDVELGVSAIQCC
eukprot:scaffold10125_cov71-Phaeocystis_antarctica.AAC.3